MSLVSINPADGVEIARYDELSEAEIDQALARAEAAFARHRQTSYAERAEKMNRAADVLDERAEEWGRLIAREMGKPVTQARSEVEKCAWVCRYYAEHAEAFLQDEVIGTDAHRSYVAYQPLGPVLAVMPWNYPFWQVFRFAAPALMAGNVGLLKHASNVTGSALAIEEALRAGGFDGDEFQTLKIGSKAVGGVIEDGRVRAATLTGSEGAGRAVGGQAGKQIKPSVLELGGSDPFIVLADADLDKAVRLGVKGRMQNNGQSCIAAKRFIVEKKIADEYVQRYVERCEAMHVGNPLDEDTDIGPIARDDLRDDIDDQVKRAVKDGAKIATGGKALDRPGYFYAPTVLTNVTPGSVAFVEEIFGPVASVILADDMDHAITLANDTTFGLGGAVFTEDRDKGEHVALQLEVGCAFVNGMVKSDPRLPFGGVKESGYGRELSHHGIREFVNIKTVWIG